MRQGNSSRETPRPQAVREGGAILSACAPVGQRRSAAALGELAPVGLHQQAVVVPAGHRQPEERLEQAVDVGGCEEVQPARHEGYAVGRIVKRAEDAKAAGQPVRKDDNPTVFEERLREYYKKTAPLTGYYYAKGRLKTVDGMASIDAVTAEIEAVLAAAAKAR